MDQLEDDQERLDFELFKEQQAEEKMFKQALQKFKPNTKGKIVI
jgi:hypothetical protein